MLRIKVDRTNQIVKQLDFVYRELGKYCDFMIAGGAALSILRGSDSLGSSDIDLWFPDVKNFNNASEVLDYAAGSALCATTSNAKTFALATDVTVDGEPTYVSIQCISKSYHPDFKDIFQNFDMSVCRVGYFDGYCVLEEETLIDINNLKIRKNQNESFLDKASGSFRASRIAKYVTKGFDFDEEFIIQSRELGYFEGKAYGSVSAGGDAY